MDIIRNPISYLLLVVLLCSTTYSQRKKSAKFVRAYPHASSLVIPPKLEAQLNKRLKLYAEYQHTNQWDKISNLLGDYLGGSKEQKLNSEQKRWMIERLRERPMISFTRLKTITTTWNMGKPIELRNWDIEGLAEFAEGSKSVKERAIVLVYRDKGEWFFTPRVITEYGWVSLRPPGI